MKLLDHNPEGAIIHFSKKELWTMLALVQEGRIAFECNEPLGQALDDGLRNMARLISEAEKGEPRH
jgi:hypothetical protein